jgi:hypothetical protein
VSVSAELEERVSVLEQSLAEKDRALFERYPFTGR